MGLPIDELVVHVSCNLMASPLSVTRGYTYRLRVTHHLLTLHSSDKKSEGVRVGDVSEAPLSI